MGVSTALTALLGIEHPVMCAGMGGITGAELAAAVSNAGGIGTLGAIGLNPKGLRSEIRRIKSMLGPGKPYGVDLLLPQVGAGARATNKDYTGGALGELVQVMVDEQVPLFVCAVGIPPPWVVEKLHANGVVIMNMVGAPKHAKRALEVGVDIICAQGTEAGAHTGDIATSVLLPQVVDICRGRAVVVGAGGIFDGRGVAACLALGADGAWIGSRFLATPEANVPEGYKQTLLESGSSDTHRIEVYTGRPLRVIKNNYSLSWIGREAEMRELLQSGVVPHARDMKAGALPSERSAIPDYGDQWRDIRAAKPHFDKHVDSVAVGQAVGAITEVLPAADVVAEIVQSLEETLNRVAAFRPRPAAAAAAKL